MTEVFPKEYLFYKYTQDLKDYVRTAVSQHFKNISIELEDLLSFIKYLREEELYKLMSSLNITISQTYVEIFYQMILIYAIDHIKQQKFLKEVFTQGKILSI